MKTHKPLKIFIILMMIMSGFAANAQQQAFFNMYEIKANEFPTIKGFFVAKGIAGEEITDLKVEDFELTENGVDKTPGLQLKCDRVDWVPPLNAVLCIDASVSMYEEKANDGRIRVEWAREGSKAFVDSVQFDPPTDPPSKIAINQFGSLIGRYAIDFQTTKPPLMTFLDDKLETVYGATNFNEPFLDPDWGAINLLKEEDPNVRRIIIFLTDGKHENGKEFKYEEVIEKCQEEKIQVYCVVIDATIPFELNEISRRTGGKAKRITNIVDFHKFYKEIEEEVQTQNVCWLEWESEYSCDESDREKEVYVKFKKYGEPYDVEQEKIYDAGPQSVAKIDVNPKKFVFGPVGQGTNEYMVDLTPNSGIFTVTGYSIVPDNGDFQIDWNGKTLPFTINEGNTHQVKVIYVKDPADPSQKFDLTFETNPCPTESIELIAPCGGDALETVSIDNVPVNTSKSSTFNQVFKNTTVDRLTGNVTIEGNDKNLFTLLSGGGAFDLGPNEYLNLTIEFTPTAVGNFDAYIDYNIQDNCANATTNLLGSSIATGFALNDYNFGLKRQMSSNNYTYKITNTGAGPVTIEAIDFTNITPNFNKVDPALPVDLGVGASVDVALTYLPQTEGLHEIEIQVTLKDVSNKLTANISGTGFLPQIRAANVNFPSAQVGETKGPLDIEIFNDSEWGNLSIKEIRFKNPTPDFDFYGSPQLTNLTINTQGQLNIPVTFEPQSAGDKVAYVEIECDAVDGTVDPPLMIYEVILSSKVLGLDINPAQVDFGEVLICAAPQRAVTITNNNSEDLVIESYGTTIPEFSVYIARTTIPPSESEDFIITFDPNSNGTYDNNLTIETNAGNTDIPLHAVGISENLTPVFEQEKYEISILESEIITLNIEIPDIEPTKVNKLDFEINYNPGIMKYQDVFTTNMSSWTWDVNTDNETNGVLTILGYGPEVSTPFNLSLNMTFTSLITDVSKDIITANTSLDDDYSCLIPQPATTEIKVIACNIDATLLQFSDLAYSVVVSPNPSTGNMKVKLNVAWEEETQIHLYNTLGVLVQELNNSTLGKGTHEFIINTNELSTGIYMLSVRSGAYIITEQVLISK